MSDVSEARRRFGFCNARSLCSFCHTRTSLLTAHNVSPSTSNLLHVPTYKMIFNNSSFLLSMLLVSTEAFTNLSVTRYNQFAYHHKSKAHQESSIVLYASSEKDDAVDEVEQTSIPCLPPIGESSFSGETSKDSEMIRLDGTSQAVNHVGSEKFELQYTCKVCETRNIYKISRMGE